jgi:hypothetical protein
VAATLGVDALPVSVLAHRHPHLLASPAACAQLVQQATSLQHALQLDHIKQVSRVALRANKAFKLKLE